jgi:signal transduction histidine kinase
MKSLRKPNPTYWSLPIARWLPERIARIPVSINTKLLIAFLCAAGLLVVLGMVGLGTLRIANDRADDLTQQQRLITEYRQINFAASEFQFVNANAILSQFSGVDQYESMYGAATEVYLLSVRVGWMKETLARFERMVGRSGLIPQKDLTTVEGLIVDIGGMIDAAKEIVTLLRAKDLAGAHAVYAERTRPLAKRVGRSSYTLMGNAERGLKAGSKLSDQSFETSKEILVWVSILAIGLALLLGYTISKSLTQPMRDIRARLREIAQGEFGGQVEVPNRDELGDLAENVNLMSRKLDQLYTELEAANRHKSVFLASMSHELRTPMNAIIGFNRLVMRRCKDILPEKQYENLGKIKVSADHLLTLINTILDLSKIEAGRMEVYPAEFALKPLLEACARTVEPMLDGKQVNIASQIPDDLPVLSTDQDKLRQIVLNLLSNATKFTEQGQIVLSVMQDDGMVAISIADTGIGIPADKLSHIFDEFTQVDGNSTRRHGGTGLGLAISRHLAVLLGGRVEVESEPGRGSTFTVIVPARFGGVKAGDGDPPSAGADMREQLAS